MKKMIVIALLLVACSPQKKLNKAVNTVLYDNASFNKVGLKWASLNPIDTSITKVITTSDTLTLRDTVDFHYIDEINKTDTLVRIINKTIYVHDSVLKYVQDNRVLAAYKDTIQSYKDRLLVTNVRLTESNKESLKYKWRFFGLVGIIVLILGVSIYSKIRP